MSKRWTEEQLKQLRPGMVVDEKKVKLPEARPSSNQLPESQRISSGREKGKTTVQALGRLRDGQMNKTEARYAQHLDLQKAAGEILWWAFEPVNLRIGKNCFLEIDFMIMRKDGALESHDVKGYWTDDALVKMRAAAEKFPWPILAVKWDRKGKQWEYRNF